MLEGRDDGKVGRDSESMVKRFHETAGALEPLTGVKLEYDKSKGLYLTHFSGNDFSNKQTRTIHFDMAILLEQANLFSIHGVSNKVLQARI